MHVDVLCVREQAARVLVVCVRVVRFYYLFLFSDVFPIFVLLFSSLFFVISFVCDFVCVACARSHVVCARALCTSGVLVV